MPVESNITSVERVLGYTHLKSEAPYEIEENKPAASWPAKGAVEFRNYSTKYRPELDPVLKNVSLRIAGGEKIGVGSLRCLPVNRTLMLFLTDLWKDRGGQIIHDLGAFPDNRGNQWTNLHRRCRYRYHWVEGFEERNLYHPCKYAIPLPHDSRPLNRFGEQQDPQLFEATVRENIDPVGLHGDAEIWTALENSYLKEFVQNNLGGLDGKVSEGGVNMSAGQVSCERIPGLRHTDS